MLLETGWDQSKPPPLVLFIWVDLTGCDQSVSEDLADLARFVVFISFSSMVPEWICDLPTLSLLRLFVMSLSRSMTCNEWTMLIQTK